MILYQYYLLSTAYNQHYEDLLFGLEMTSYTVSEGSQSTLSVCVLVLEGQLARSVPLLLLTSSGSATGKQSNPTTQCAE